MADRKDRMALLSRYSKHHTFFYEEKPRYNINVEQWAADALIESYGIQYCYDLLAYYFEVSQNPSWNYFCYNTENIIESRDRIERDKQERAERRKLAKAWLGE